METDYIVDDRENTKEFVRSVQNMSEAEFQEFIRKLKESEKD